MKQNHDCYALIMAGGVGKRFRPLSTNKKPKQFIKITDNNYTLLQQTFSRLSGLFHPKKVWVATNHRYIPLVLKQLPSLQKRQIFGETHKKNTAPCLAWASYQIFRKDKKAIVVALPADHFILPTRLFQKTIQKGLELAQKRNTMVTIGIKPTHPSTQYGYIHRAGGGKVRQFVEKPDMKTARRYVKEGNYFWNGGIFIFPVAKMLEWIDEFLPKMSQLLKKKRSLKSFFKAAESISIDYGVMEKAKGILVLKAPFKWSDVGTWENLKHLAQEHSLKLPPEVRQYLK